MNSVENRIIFGQDLVCDKIKCGENTPYNRHAAALKKCNLAEKDYTLYSWKHTGVVNAYLSGVGLKQFQNLLRHISLEETDIYLKSFGFSTDPDFENYG